MNITKLISTVKDNLTRLIVKVRRLGLSDVQTGYQLAPWGYDSNPVTDKKYVPVFAKTGVKGETVIVGYIQQGMLTDPGEVRLFQIFEGELGTQLWLRNNKIELGGTTDAPVMHDALDLALQAEASAINTELAKISAAIGALGGAYAVAPISLDISAAKSTKTVLS